MEFLRDCRRGLHRLPKKRARREFCLSCSLSNGGRSRNRATCCESLSAVEAAALSWGILCRKKNRGGQTRSSAAAVLARCFALIQLFWVCRRHAFSILYCISPVRMITPGTTEGAGA